MTALREFERLEATGLWRASAEAQRREVIVSIGEATLTIADMNERALAHWSLAAVERQGDGFPAIYHPDGDPEETLELDESETTMIDAIEKLRRAVARTRPRPGRLRWVGGISGLVLLLFLVLFWLPGALMQHTLNVVPQIKRDEIGEALLARIERVSGRACETTDTGPILTRLADRIGVRRIVVLKTGVQDSALLPGGIVILNKSLIEDFEDPSIAAGYVLAERVQAEIQDPLGVLLNHSGVAASVRLLTTGTLTNDTLDRFAEWVPRVQGDAPPDEPLLRAFDEVSLSSAPYAFARDITGESVLGLIEADPMAGKQAVPAMPDRDWVLLQSICGG